MDVSFVTVNDIRIAYFEKNAASDATIIFIHGNSVAKDCWRKQYNSPPFDQYRLIAFDLPGCGDSDKSPDPSTGYTLPGLGAFAAKIIKAIAANKPFVIVGLSLGTNIVAELLPMVQPVGIALAGASIFGAAAGLDKIVIPGTQVGVVFTERADENNVLQYAKEVSLSPLQDDTDIFISSYYTTDPALRTTLAAGITDGTYSDEIRNLQEKNISSLIVFGKDEKVVYPDYLDNVPLPLWNNLVYLIEDASHLVNIDQPEAFNKLLAEYSADCFR